MRPSEGPLSEDPCGLYIVSRLGEIEEIKFDTTSQELSFKYTDMEYESHLSYSIKKKFNGQHFITVEDKEIPNFNTGK